MWGQGEECYIVNRGKAELVIKNHGVFVLAL